MLLRKQIASSAEHWQNNRGRRGRQAHFDVRVCARMKEKKNIVGSLSRLSKAQRSRSENSDFAQSAHLFSQYAFSCLVVPTDKSSISLFYTHTGTQKHLRVPISKRKKMLESSFVRFGDFQRLLFGGRGFRILQQPLCVGTVECFMEEKSSKN